MAAWIVRLMLILAAPIAAFLIARHSLNFGLVQTFVAILLVVGLLLLAALWSKHRFDQQP